MCKITMNRDKTEMNIKFIKTVSGWIKYAYTADTRKYTVVCYLTNFFLMYVLYDEANSLEYVTDEKM